jgi:hypothetical protein
MSQRLDYNAAAPAGMKRLGAVHEYVRQSGLPSRLVTCLGDRGVPDSAYQAAAAVFSEKQLADLTIAIGLMNAYNRLSIPFRTTPAAVARKAA